MSHFTFTLAIAAILVMIALLALGLGFFVGRKKLKNRCGQIPNKDGSCDEKGTCSMCEDTSEKDKP